MIKINKISNKKWPHQIHCNTVRIEYQDWCRKEGKIKEEAKQAHLEEMVESYFDLEPKIKLFSKRVNYSPKRVNYSPR